MRLIAATVLTCASISTSATSGFSQEKRDDFHWVDRMNRASSVMLREKAIVNEEQAKQIAHSIRKLHTLAQEPGFSRVGTYGVFEPRLIEIGGPEVSRLHTGRSTIDTLRTSLRMDQRELLLETYGALIKARESLLNFAKQHADAIIPAYTLGVQAQPTTIGHYITGYIGAYNRHADNLEAVFDNVNKSPLGSAALGTSSYPVDRLRLAELLGFDEPIRNSFDSVQLAPMETNMRLGAAGAGIAMTTGELMSDLENQYRMARPWITFPVNLTGGSTIMPQKLNPTGINNTKEDASKVLGHFTSYMFGAHKASSGDTDLIVDGPREALRTTMRVLNGVASMFASFRFDERRAMEEVEADYATATELANALQRDGGIPFRDAHHIAAVVVQYGRDNNLKASEIPFAAFEEIYDQVRVEHNIRQRTSGLTEENFKRVLRPENMVRSAKGYGGPQPDEVRKMIEEISTQIGFDKQWLETKRQQLAKAEKRLDEEFAKF
jgi:argininosuccinate lyase